MTGQEKKIKISELPASVTFKGLWTVGYQDADGRKTSVKVSLAEIQGAYDNVVEATQEARKATQDLRELEAVVQGNEEERENFYSSSQALVQGWSNDEQKRKEAETSRVEEENKRVQAENKRKESEEARKEAESKRVEAENSRGRSEEERKTNEEVRQKQESEREKDSAEAVKNAKDATDRLNALSDHRDEIRDGYWWRWDEETGEWYNTGEIAKGNVMYATFQVDPATGVLTMFTDEEYTGANFTLDENGILSVKI